MFIILFHYTLPFLRQLHNFTFPKLFIFLSKELFQVPFTVFQEMEFFLLGEFCKDQKKKIPKPSKGAMSGESSGGISNSFYFTKL